MASDRATSGSTYRVSPFPGFIGVMGLLLLGYILLYNAGIIDLRLFPKAGDFPLSKPGPWLVYALYGASGFGLLWFSAGRIQITDDGITFAAPAYRVLIRWADVTAVELSKGPGFDVRSKTSHIIVHMYFVQLKRLKSEILKRVDPSVVRERQTCFGRWLKSRGKS